MMGYVHSLESFGAMDGPGIRFVVFLEGCPMRCQYCHNPDTWEMQQKDPHDGGGDFAAVRRLQGVLPWGHYRHRGRPLMQMEFVTQLFTQAKQKGIHTCLDTSGILFDPEHTEKMDALLAVTDLVMLDIKEIDPQKHLALTGQPNEKILAYAQYLAQKGIPIWIRHVVVPGITDDLKDLFALGEFIAGLKTIQALDVLPYHDMGKVKYKAMGIPYPLETAAAPVQRGRRQSQGHHPLRHEKAVKRRAETNGTPLIFSSPERESLGNFFVKF